MIHDVDETLRAMIRRDVVNGSGVEISFEAPTKDWAAKRTTPTVNVYLYDIREDTTRREMQYEEVRDESGRVVQRRQPPRRFRLSYLITAWTQRPEDEHRLLSAMLGLFLKSDLLPPDLLVGGLRDAGRPTIAQVALPPTEDRSISDVWSALGGELKPSLDLVVIAPFTPGRTEVDIAPPVRESPRLSVARAGAEPEEVGKGRRRKAGATGAQQAADEAMAAAQERQLAAAGGAAGGGGAAAGGAAALAGRGGRAAAGAASEAPLASETMQPGGDDAPGRVLKVHEMPRKRP